MTGAGNQEIDLISGGVQSEIYANAGTLALAPLTSAAGRLTLSSWLASMSGKLSVDASASAGFTPLTLTSASGQAADIIDVQTTGNTAGSLLVLNSAGRVGIGTTTPHSTLSVNGGAAIGSYAGTNAAPSNGLIVSGQTGIGTAAPNAAALLDVFSTTQGFLPPRMTNAQETAIGTNVAGTNEIAVYYP